MRVLFPLLLAAALGACREKPRAENASEKEAVIAPLNVRDPSALVMGPIARRSSGFEVDAIAQTDARACPPPRRSSWSRLFARRTGRAPMADGYRAVSLPLREYELLNLKPGDRVDVLSVFDALTPPKRKETFSATILQNVKVLGVTLSGDLDGQGVLHLMLNPTEAQLAVLALRQGDLAVVLRRPGDAAIHPMEMSSYRKLFL